MPSDSWKSLQSGTDIRGAALENDREPVNLTAAAVERIAGGFLLWLERRLQKPAHKLTVAVGRDSRLSGPALCAALSRAMVQKGVQVFDCGLASTPSMFMAVRDLPCDAAVEVTASHHPWYRNGLKFFLRDGGLDAPDIETLLQLARQGEAPADAPGGRLSPCDHMATYAAHLRALICDGLGDAADAHPLAGFKIAVDAGNGVGGFYAKEVLAPLGADVSGSVCLTPDGHFPNHIPNPEDETAMASICRAVRESGSDLGVIFDTDVDRAGAVDADGREINRNRLIALSAAIALRGCPGGTVVTDSITSDGLKAFIENDLGGRHHRFKRGYKNVINEALRLNAEGVDCPLAMETSGHAALRENYFLDDGAYLCTKIIIEAARLRRQGKTLNSLLSGLREPAETLELRLPIHEADFRAAGNAAIARLEEAARAKGWAVAPDSYEGVRISFPEERGWCLLRLSVHDPILPLNIESDVPGGVQAILNRLRPLLPLPETV